MSLEKRNWKKSSSCRGITLSKAVNGTFSEGLGAYLLAKNSKDATKKHHPIMVHELTEKI